MTHLDLFAGIGGFSLAGRWVWDEFQTVAFVEWNAYCQQLLAQQFPGIPIYGDIKQYHYHGGPVDLLTGGFPCQPFSHAGKRKGAADDRFLWPEMLRVIREAQPRWIVAENVPGILSQDGGLVFERVCAELETEGYEVQPVLIPAAGVGAPHRRERVWIVAYTSSNGYDGGVPKAGGTVRGGEPGRMLKPEREDRHAPNTRSERLQGWLTEQIRMGLRGFANRARGNEGRNWQEHWYEVATRLCRVDDGIPNRLDRIKALGNSISPQVAAQIYLALKRTDEEIPAQEKHQGVTT